ncbi:MAG: serine/threonine protein kinase [Myxococcales bacterium]|nr:serine/threonine protein kinase [Myxococcales bacterium]
MEGSPVQPGFRLDRYELLCPLAYGGMASVWLARFGGRLGFEKLVVVKMILPQYAQDPRFQQMFMDEARIASRIEHQNVARILDVGEHGGHYFIVMEWVDGDSVSKIMRALEARKEHIPTGIGLRIGADAAAGLHAAHELKDQSGATLGVVHRDVSPQNILVSTTGASVLIDFGVAKARDRVSQETSVGQLKGKVRYMAPEQAVGREIDRRADIFSLGAVLYELFAGRPPFDGSNEVAILHALTAGTPPPPLPDRVPPPVANVIMRALDHDVDKRFATALEMSLSLEAAISEIGETTNLTAVASYCDRLLAERRAGRKRSVDAALAQARQRDAGGVTSDAPKLPQPPTPPPGSVMPSGPQAVAGTPSGITPPPPTASESHGSAMSLAESPSATSTATLGSAAIEYPPRSEPYPKRKYLGAAAVGVLMAGILIAAAAAVRSAVSSSSSTPPAAAETVAGDPPEPPTTAPTTSAPPVLELPSEPPTAATTTTAAAAATTTPPRPTTAPTTPRPATPAAATAKPATPKPAPVPTATTKPTSTAKPAPTKKDYGF